MDDLLGHLLCSVAEVLIQAPAALLTHEPERRAPAAVVPRPSRRRIVLPESSPTAQYVGPGYAAKVGKGTRCQVCGDSLELDVVSCPSCATLHHDECWTYNGGCSTYGCRRTGGT